MIDIRGIDKGALVAALYNHSKPQGFGELEDAAITLERGSTAMTVATGTDVYAQHTERGTTIHYLGGRVMKVDLRGDAFDETFYDRDNGPGAAARATDEARTLTAEIGG